MYWTLTNAATNLKRRAHRRKKRGRLRFPALWLMTDEDRLPNPAIALAHLPRGAGLILRHYNAAGRVAIATQLSRLCRHRGVMLLIAGDWRLASHVGAAGVHLAEHAARAGLPAGGRLWRRENCKLLTVAAHGNKGLRRAVELHATAAILAPIFKTASHPGRAPLGLTRAAALIRQTAVPVVALGGINTSTIRGLRHSGCAGVAGIGLALPPNA